MSYFSWSLEVNVAIILPILKTVQQGSEGSGVSLVITEKQFISSQKVIFPGH